ncbi:MAG: TRAP transporter small permease subunit [Trueperaceae bacterium]
MKQPNVISRILEYVSAIGLLGIVVILLFQLMVRTLSFGSFSWTDELARYLMISMVFLAAPAVLEVDEHIKVEFFVDRLPPVVKDVIIAVSAILVAAFAAFLAYSSINLMTNLSSSRTPALRMPMPLFLAGAVIGSAALALAGCLKAYSRICDVFVRNPDGRDSEGDL